MGNLLFEIGCEELPASFVGPAIAQLTHAFESECDKVGLTHGPISSFATPRRLALLVQEVSDRTAAVESVAQGPSIQAAFDANGEPKIAARKFAESVGRSIDRLDRVETPKGTYLSARVIKNGQDAPVLLPQILGKCLRRISFPKSMRWGDVDVAFARPIQWIVAMLDQAVLPLAFGDVASGSTTFGHRAHAPGPQPISAPDGYEALLRDAHVLASRSARARILAECLKEVAASIGATSVPDAALEEQVVDLLEAVHPIVGSFDPKYLKLPREVLIQEMKTHQRYFALASSDGRLLPKFVAISNTQVRNPDVSRRGFEEVLRARLADAQFFFDEDRKLPLAKRAERLTRRTWFKPLGTMDDKAKRIGKLAQVLAIQAGVSGIGSELERSAALCKADLESGMVGEFPELQGVMGRVYALADGEAEAIAVAIEEHYLPRHSGDALPVGNVGALLGMADRIDSIVGLFALGRKPTGAKDEAGVRRACLAVISIALHHNYHFKLSAILDEAYALLEPMLASVKGASPKEALVAEILTFFRGRLATVFGEGSKPDIVDAVLAAGIDDLAATRDRVAALRGLSLSPQFASLVTTFKRAANIVEKQARQVPPGPVRKELLGKLVGSGAEKHLHLAIEAQREAIAAATIRGDFVGVLAAVTELEAPVAAFFNEVMVMCDDIELRTNRIRLLQSVAALLSNQVDLSRIQST